MAESKASQAWIVALVAVIGLVVVAAIAVNGHKDQQQDLVTVTGTSQMDVAPDQAVMVFQVQTNGTDAKDVSAQNKQLLQQVMAALDAQGIPKEKIETTGVTLQRRTEYDGTLRRMVDRGYQQVTTVKVTVEDLTKVGPVLDATINAGANAVQDVSFELKPATQERVKQQVLADATKAAKTKAQILADAAGARLGGIAQLSESSYIRPMTYNVKTVMDMAGGMAESAPTPISPQQVTVEASVSMAYELK